MEMEIVENLRVHRVVEKWKGFLLLAVQSFICLPCCAMDLPEVRSEMNRIQQQVRTSQERIRGLRSDEDRANEQLQSITDDIARVVIQKNDQTAIAAEATARLQQAQSELQTSEEAVNGEDEQFRERVVASYKLRRRTGTVDYLMRSSSSPELLKRARYLVAVSDYDRGVLEEMQQRTSTLRWKESVVADRQKDEQAALDKISSLEADLEQRKSKEAALLSQLQKGQADIEEAVEKYQDSLDQLEVLLARLMGRGEDAANERQHAVKIHHVGIGDSTEALIVPDQGEVVRDFGVVQPDGLRRELQSKGIELRVPLRSEVHAVAAGKIVFAGELPNMGKVVIIDHGKRQYSLYGRLEDLRCAEEQDVSQGQTVGLAMEVEGEGRLYFEIRDRGTAQNPWSYLDRGSFASSKS